MRIGEAARRTGASPRALRHYEDAGVLRPQRTPSGYRVYSDDDLRVVHLVQTLLRAGLNLDLIRQILTCMAGEELLLVDCRERLLTERARMTETIASLVSARATLDELLESTT
ncbi:MAG: MerR family transcriptional regulator [Tetrasphaera sp.]